MESNNVFKVGKLQNLDSKIEVSELENGCLDFLSVLILDKIIR